MMIREWIFQNYKSTRLEGLDAEIPGYSETVIRQHEERFAKAGETIISHHESRTDRMEVYRG